MTTVSMYIYDACLYMVFFYVVMFYECFTMCIQIAVYTRIALS